MAATRGNDRRLSDEQLGELITLLKDVDTVELKLTVPQADQRAVVTGLQVDPLEAQIRQVFFFDTPDLALNKAGVVLRARRVQQKGDDSVVKLRPVVPSTLSEVIRRSPGFGVEVDAMPGGFVCSASMKGAPTGVREASFGQRPLRKLFSKEQREFYAAHAPEGIAIDDLSILGPLFVLKLSSRRGVRPEAGRRDVAVPGRIAASSSSRRNALRARRSRSPPSRGRSSRRKGSTSAASRRRRRRGTRLLLEGAQDEGSVAARA